MPRYSPSDEDMEGLYQDSPSKPKEPTPDKPTEDKEESGVTAIVDNKLLSPEGQELNEGDEITVKVVKNYGTESEITYCQGKDESKPGMGGEMSADDELESMNKE